MLCICAKAVSQPFPPSVQKNATAGRRSLFAVKYARTGEETDQAQTGVPITTKSKDEGSFLAGRMLAECLRRASITDLQ